MCTEDIMTCSRLVLPVVCHSDEVAVSPGKSFVLPSSVRLGASMSHAATVNIITKSSRPTMMRSIQWACSSIRMSM